MACQLVHVSAGPDVKHIGLKIKVEYLAFHGRGLNSLCPVHELYTVLQDLESVHYVTFTGPLLSYDD